MADQRYLDLLKQGRETWNPWRQEHLGTTSPDLSGASLSGIDLSHFNLLATYLKDADLSQTNLSWTTLTFACLYGANLSKASLAVATLYKTDLRGADLVEANLSYADFTEADLSGANLKGARLIGTCFHKTNLTSCNVYGASVWDVELKGAIQNNLVITNVGQSAIMVDNLKVAQFIHLLLNNEEIREVIDTITSKVVLILGRFTAERKAVLDALRNELRKHNYSPVLFDFEKPANRDLTETVSTLAHLARFIIVDLTDPSSAPHEVATVIPQTVVPVQPLLLQEPLLVDGKMKERREYAMFEDLRRRYHWVLPTFRYQNTAELLASLQAHIIAPAEQKASELMQPR